ncbi:hypothetical protein, partial [Pseudomonas sp. C11]|uniref:hypothetical protein n=1 Tax=Pseudomonas sp. C11 TaxID=3075550 RepID=UPI002AFE27DB
DCYHYSCREGASAAEYGYATRSEIPVCFQMGKTQTLPREYFLETLKQACSILYAAYQGRYFYNNAMIFIAIKKQNTQNKKT